MGDLKNYFLFIKPVLVSFINSDNSNIISTDSLEEAYNEVLKSFSYLSDQVDEGIEGNNNSYDNEDDGDMIIIYDNKE